MVLLRLRSLVNRQLEGWTPADVLFGGVCTPCTLYILFSLIPVVSKFGVSGTMQLMIIRLLQMLPGGASVLKSEADKASDELKHALVKTIPLPLEAHYSLPQTGISRDRIMAELMHYLKKEVKTRSCKAHGGVYVGIKYDQLLGPNSNSDDESKSMQITKEESKSASHEEFLDALSKLSIKDAAYVAMNHNNVLYPMLFPAARKFESEIVSMVANMVSAPVVAGNVSSGGTESIFLAVAAYRARMEDVKGWNTRSGQNSASLMTRPKLNLVVPETAHPAFWKACHYLQIEIRVIDSLKDGSYKVDTRALESAIDSNTIGIVGSAPSFPYCVLDDLKELSEIALRKKVLFHVDNCLGGFTLSMLKKAGKLDIDFDFSLEGVTSMSIDVHKQVGASKGCSVVVYRNLELHAYQFYCYTDWSGGLYCSPTFRGSGNGGILSSAWSHLVSKGVDGLVDMSVKQYEGHQYLLDFLIKDDYLCKETRILGYDGSDKNSVMPMGIAIECVNCNSYSVNEALNSLYGWSLGLLQFPKAIHYQMGQRQANRQIIEMFVQNLKESIVIVKEDPSKYYTGMAAMYGGTTTIADRSLVENSLKSYLQVMSAPLCDLLN